MTNSVHIDYRKSLIANIENINFHKLADKIHVEFNDLETLSPLLSDLNSMKMDDIEISEEYRYFFETIIGDLEKSLNESHEWMKSRNA